MPKGITHETPPNRCRLQITRNNPRRFRSRGTLVQLSCAVLPHGRMSTSLSTGNGGYCTTSHLDTQAAIRLYAWQSESVTVGFQPIVFSNAAIMRLTRDFT